MLEPIAQVGCEPVEYGFVKSVGGLQQFEKRAVVDVIKGYGQVKERQHREVARI